MTRKDYELIAKALKNENPADVAAVLPYAAEEQYTLCCESMARALATDNPRFDRARFLKACGLEA